ncbi:unnamed protein product [Vitrella brassicaformis CCMP3155]|uniref:Uncharacterized protein n=1 Tax=Vitrella brassicaformis (strain CCMP3155) TaxID=1169540 RepID=A0A0G4ES31_VITBC|nr:unnamed protein product [Vitrella brassicaformis CCMP3155]|eukprot:CEM01079.1 unnamed protein product [Vitrella brassicaformis CCMP3155]
MDGCRHELYAMIGECALAHGRTEEDAIKVYTTLSSQWLNTADALRQLTSDQWKQLGLPVGLINALKSKIGAADTQIASGGRGRGCGYRLGERGTVWGKPGVYGFCREWTDREIFDAWEADTQRTSINTYGSTLRAITDQQQQQEESGSQVADSSCLDDDSYSQLCFDGPP